MLLSEHISTRKEIKFYGRAGRLHREEEEWDKRLKVAAIAGKSAKERL
jgi:hypothetical protein